MSADEDKRSDAQTKTVAVDVAECPWCGEDFERICEWDMSDGDALAHHCPSCEEDIHITCAVSKTYTTRRRAPATEGPS